jgi:predicted transcriptional regulator
MQFNLIQLFRTKNYSHMRSRDRIEIMSQILEAAAKNEQSGGGGATKTWLKCSSLLTYTQLKHYLSILTDSGLLQYDSLSERFKTTEKGLSFLKAYREIEQVTKGLLLQRPQTKNSDQVIPGLF